MEKARQYRILVVDERGGICDIIDALGDKYSIEHRTRANDSLGSGRYNYDCILVNASSYDKSLEFLSRAKKNDPTSAVLVVANSFDVGINEALEYMRMGAYDLILPDKDGEIKPEYLEDRIRAAIGKRRGLLLNVKTEALDEASRAIMDGVNNPLTIIYGWLQEIRNGVGITDEIINEMTKACGDIRDVVASLQIIVENGKNGVEIPLTPSPTGGRMLYMKDRGKERKGN